MPNDVQLVIRVPSELADRIKSYAERLTGEVGVNVSVAAATRKLLGDAMDAVEKKGKR